MAKAKELYGKVGAQLEDGRFAFRNEIGESKLLDLVENRPNAWSGFINEVKAQYTGVMDLAANPLPNYSFMIILENSRVGENITLRRSFRFVLSLLTQHYTYYFEDWHTMEEFEIPNSIHPPFLITIS